jgi:uncharacterized RDD family membrane protein YckC
MPLAYYSAASLIPGMSLRDAVRLHRHDVRENRVIPFIIVLAIIVLLALAITVVAGAIIACSIHGGVFDTVANIKNGMVSIKCHRI